MSFVPNQPRLFVNGNWVSTNRTAPVVNPFDGSTIANIPLADEKLIDEAIASSQQSFEGVRDTPAHKRASILHAAADLIEKRCAELADLIVAEAGKPITLAEAEVTRAISTFTAAAAEESRQSHDEVIQTDAFPVGEGYVGLARRFPIGVIYGITPFNFPLNLVAHKVAPAIATNNAILIKPSPRTPLTALLLADILADAGLPAGQLNVIVAPNELAQRPLNDDRIKHVSFTGSTDVGWKIKQSAGKKRVTLELGGNAGVIVHEDADLDSAVQAIASGGFGYAGQSCISVQRVIIQEKVYERFRAALVEHVRDKVKCGDPKRRDVIVGPMIDQAALDRVVKAIDQARRAGAKILCGGEVESRCLQPTVIEGAGRDLDVCATEIFAPVVVLQSYNDFDQAVAAINDTRFGLQAGVFTRDLSLAMRAYQALAVGGVIINQAPTFRLDNMPYGGVKDSGFGREGVKYAMSEMTEIKALIMKI